MNKHSFVTIGGMFMENYVSLKKQICFIDNVEIVFLVDSKQLNTSLKQKVGVFQLIVKYLKIFLGSKKPCCIFLVRCLFYTLLWFVKKHFDILVIAINTTNVI